MHLRYMYGIQGAQRAKKPLTAHSMLLPRPGGKGKESEDMKIGFWELVVIVVIAFVFIGPDQLPDYAKKLGKMFGKTMNNFKKGMEESDDEAETTTAKAETKTEKKDDEE